MSPPTQQPLDSGSFRDRSGRVYRVDGRVIRGISPCWGWRNRERVDLESRTKPQLILCLALVHHIVITANIPMRDFVGWLADLADQLIIEYVSRGDEKVRILLRNKTEEYADYSKERFERALSDHFRIEARQAIQSGNRVLYFCRRP